MIAIAKIFDLLPGWFYCLCIVGLLALLGVDSVRIAHARAQYSELQTQIAQERQKAAEVTEQAEKDARTEEERREQRKQEIVDEANHDTEIAKAAADSANAAAVGLRQRVAALVASARKGSGNPPVAGSGSGQQDSDPIGMLAGLFNRVGEDTGQLSAYADQLRIAGAACERSYDALQPGR